MSYAVQGHPRQTGVVESSDKTWSTGEGNGNPLQYPCQENPMDSVKRLKDMMPEDELLRSEGVQYATGEERRAIPSSSERVKRLGQSRKDAQLWVCLEVKG